MSMGAVRTTKRADEKAAQRAAELERNKAVLYGEDDLKDATFAVTTLSPGWAKLAGAAIVASVIAVGLAFTDRSNLGRRLLGLTPSR